MTGSRRAITATSRTAAEALYTSGATGLGMIRYLGEK